MHMYVCVYMYVCMCIHVCMYVYTCMYVCVYMYVCMYVCMRKKPKLTLLQIFNNFSQHHPHDLTYLSLWWW